jgi:hypothetical protein
MSELWATIQHDRQKRAGMTHMVLQEFQLGSPSIDSKLEIGSTTILEWHVETEAEEVDTPYAP